MNIASPSSTGHRGPTTLFSAPKQRGHDTQCRDHSAHHEGSMQPGHERLLQRPRLLDPESLPAGYQGRTGRRAAKAREDRARHRDAQALTDDAPGGQYAGGDTQLIRRRGSHDRARVGRLEKSLPDPGDGQAQNEVGDRAGLSQPAQEQQARAGDGQP